MTSPQFTDATLPKLQKKVKNDTGGGKLLQSSFFDCKLHISRNT